MLKRSSEKLCKDSRNVIQGGEIRERKERWKRGEGVRNIDAETQRAYQCEPWWFGHAHSMRHNQHAAPKMMFLESHKDVHICTHIHTQTQLQKKKKKQHTDTRRSCPEKDPFMWVSCWEEDWEAQNPSLLPDHNSAQLQGRGLRGQSNLFDTHRHTDTHTFQCQNKVAERA